MINFLRFFCESGPRCVTFSFLKFCDTSLYLLCLTHDYDLRYSLDVTITLFFHQKIVNVMCMEKMTIL